MVFLCTMDFTIKIKNMKKLFLLMVTIAFSVSVPAQESDGNEKILQDSTFHQRFIMSILQEYELEGRWLFVRVDSLYKLKNNFELINPQNIYDAYAEGSTSYNKKSFLFNAYQTFRQQKQERLERYPNMKHPIKGIKVNIKRYGILKKMPVAKILSTYFNKDKKLRAKYKKLLYEIIAVCYTNNVKVVTRSDGVAYYEVFK
jgi:hypothetical protein